MKGSCAGTRVKLKYNLSEIFIYAFHSNGNIVAVSSKYLDELHFYPFGIMYSWSGKVKLEFDYEKNKISVYFNNTKIDEFNLKSVYIDQIELWGGNGCCDGRNDAYFYFDNITLIPYGFAYEEIPYPTNKSLLITNSEWRNVVAASPLEIPVLVSESGSITPEIERFIHDYKPDLIYTVGFSIGLNNSFEITKGQIDDFFFPNATMAVYVNNMEKGIFAGMIGKYLGIPVVFDKINNYTDVIDLENMNLQEIQDFYLEKVKENGGNIDYLVLVDLNSPEGLLAGRLAGMRNGYVVPIENKSFENITDVIKEVIKELGTKKFYHKHVKYKAGKPLYLAILGEDESVPYARFFDPGLEILDNKDGWWLYSDLGYADSNENGFFDLAVGRMKGGIETVSLHLARNSLPRNQSAIFIGEYRHPRIADLKFLGGGMTQAFVADMLLDMANISTKRVVEKRLEILGNDNSTIFELYQKYREWYERTAYKVMLKLIGKIWGIFDYSDMIMYAVLEFDWSDWEKRFGLLPVPEHLEVIDENVGKTINSTGIVGYFGLGDDGWTIPKKERSYWDNLLYPYLGSTEFKNITFSGFLYNDYDISANSTITKNVIREGGSVLGSSGIIHDPYTIRTSTAFFFCIALRGSVGQCLIESVNIDPVQEIGGFVFLNYIYKLGGEASILTHHLLSQKDSLERILFGDPAVVPLERKIVAPVTSYSIKPSGSFVAESFIETNYTINDGFVFLNAENYLIENERPIIPVFVRKFVLPEGAVVNWINLSGNYSGKEISSVFVYNDSHYTNWTEITIQCIEFLGFEGLEELDESQEKRLSECIKNILKPNVSYPYPNETLWWKEDMLLDNRTAIYVFVPAVIFQNESYGLVLEKAKVEVDYESWIEMGVFAEDVFLGENETLKVGLMNAGSDVSGRLWIFVEGEENFEFSEEVFIPENSSLIREFSFAPGIGNYEVISVFEYNNGSVGPRYSYFSVESPPNLLVDDIPDVFVNEGESGCFQTNLKNNGSFILENISINYSGVFVIGFDINELDLYEDESAIVEGCLDVPDMIPPGNYTGFLSFVPENDKPVYKNFTIIVPPRAVPEINESIWEIIVKPTKYVEKSFIISNSGNVPLEADIYCNIISGISCEIMPERINILPGEESRFSAKISVPGGYESGEYYGNITVDSNGPEKNISLKIKVLNVSYWLLNPLELFCKLPECFRNLSIENLPESNAVFEANISVENLSMVFADSIVSVEPGKTKNFSFRVETPSEGIYSGEYKGNIVVIGNEYSEPKNKTINITVLAEGPEFDIAKNFIPEKIILFWDQFVIPKINHVEIYLNNTGEVLIEKIAISDEIPDGWKGKKPVISFVKRNRKFPLKDFLFSSEGGYANFSFDFSESPLGKGEVLEIHYMIYAEPGSVPIKNIKTNTIAEARSSENIYSENSITTTLYVEYFNPPQWLRWFFVLLFRLW
ncbi:MAG: hypothetical protein QXN71_00360 [Candidatus Aenigmatarchaeota archaeon]